MFYYGGLAIAPTKLKISSINKELYQVKNQLVFSQCFYISLMTHGGMINFY